MSLVPAEKFLCLSELSDRTLEAYELSKRNEAANLSKELRHIEEKIVDARVEAELARKIRDLRREITLTKVVEVLPNALSFEDK